jgi:hypothetical protein
MKHLVEGTSTKASVAAVSAVFVLALSCSWPLPVQGAGCRPKLLPEKVLRLIRPLMAARAQQAKELEEGRNWDPTSPLSQKVDRLLTVVLRDGTTAGDQAVAYLLTVYMGESYAEGITCEVLSRGRRMLPLVKAVKECQPLTGLEPLPQAVYYAYDPTLASILEDLEKGKGCDD